MADTRRVLITGVSRFWGGQLARRLEARQDIERIVAVDTQAPTINLQRTDFVRADIRHSLIDKLLRALDIDTVVHAGLIVDPRRATPRVVHETNVIGTMNLIAACSGADSPVRKLVVKSSTAIYGCEPDDPSFWSEAMTRKSAPRDSFTRDLDEVEAYVNDFALRKPAAVTTTLRFVNVLGGAHSTPFSRFFDLPVIPAVLGFDPRLQFVHEEDATAILEQAVTRDRPGVFNVAGSGIVLFSQAIALLGKRNAPILPFAGSSIALSVFNRVTGTGFPPHLARLLQFGRVVDTSRLQSQFAELEWSTLGAVKEHARRRRLPAVVEEKPYMYESELEEFLRARRVASNGHGDDAPRRRSARRPNPRSRARR